MKTVKSKISPELVKPFMRRHPLYPTTALAPIPSGERSQPFYFNSRNREYVLRLNLEQRGFLKDAHAAKMFAGTPLPVPDIVHQGEFDKKHHYAISPYAEGVGLYDYEVSMSKHMLDQVVSCLDRIHQTGIAGSGGYGIWRSHDKRAPHASWSAALKAIQDLYEWDNLYREQLIDRGVIGKIYTVMESLLAYCPQERRLIHGDFKGANIRHNGRRITGILDWSESMYGDYLFDIAWIDLWDERTDYKQVFYDYYWQQGRVPLFYNERIQCYQYYSALLSLGFNATTGQLAKNERVLRLLRLADAKMPGRHHMRLTV